MIAGAEGLALIPFIPLLLMGLGLLGLGVLLLLVGGGTSLAGGATAPSFGKAGALSGALGVGLILVFAAIGMHVAWRDHAQAEAKHDVKLSAAFDLRTAHSFTDLGLDRWVEKETSLLDDTFTQKIDVAGEITVDVQVTDRLRYRGRLTSLKVDDDRQDARLFRSVWMATTPMAWDACANAAASAKDLSSEERAKLEQWRDKRLGRELWFDSPDDRRPHVTVFLPLSNAVSTSCILTVEVFWQR